MQSSCQQQLNAVDEVCGVGAAEAAGCPVLAVAASPSSACVGISWFLTRPLLGNKAPLKTSESHVLALKDHCFLFHNKETGPGRGQTETCLGSQSKTMAGPCLITQVSCISVNHRPSAEQSTEVWCGQ